MNKEGQFFLVAALIIVGIIIGSFTLVNYIRSNEENKAFYDLADEVGFEARRVLDYGTFNGTNVSNVTKDFLITYANYISKDSILFIYGNKSNVVGWFFNQTPAGNIGINTGTIPGTITIKQLTGQQAQISYDQSQQEVNVSIENLVYNFRLREGENFYFVIIKDENDERFVAQG